MATPVNVSTTLTKEALRRSWEQFLRKYKRDDLDTVALAYPEDTSLAVPYWQLSKHDDELADATLHKPQASLDAASHAARSIETPIDETLDLTVRLHSLPEHWLLRVRELRAEHLGRLIAIRGLVKKSSEVRPKLEVAAFTCRRCGHKQHIEQDDHLTFKEPSGCPQCEKQSQFRFLEDESAFVDTQRLEIQEPPEGLRGGEQPERLAAYVEGDLAGDTAAGDRVVLNGILKSDQRRIKGQDSTLFDLFLDVNSIEVQEQEFEEVNIDDEEIDEILDFSQDPDLYHKIVESVAPTIQGMEMEKQALGMQLFGGVSKRMPDGSRIRGDIHTLLVGDPGVAKSQLLRFAAKLAPRSVYTSGKSSTSAGLTASAVRDELADGRWTLEAGALVLADKGLCAIDEIDKMDQKDQSSMHEGMEQQSYHPSSEVWLSDGRKVRIGEFVDSMMEDNEHAIVEGRDCEILPVTGAKVHSFDFRRNVDETRSIARVSRHEAPEEFVRIRFSNGREILVTPEHPVYTAGTHGPATRPAETIEEGAWVPAPLRAHRSDKLVELEASPVEDGAGRMDLPDELDGDLAEVLGFIVAHGPSFADPSEEPAGKARASRERISGLAAEVFGAQGPGALESQGTVTRRWASANAYEWIASNFPEVLQAAHGTRVPAAVLGSSEEIVRRFLVGAFQESGCLESTAVGFVAESRKLAEDYADALVTLGIGSRVAQGASGGWRTYVTGDSLDAFEEKIVGPAGHRGEPVEEALRRSRENPELHERFPPFAARELRAMHRELGTGLGGVFDAFVENEYGVRRSVVRAHLGIVRDRLRDLEGGLSSVASVRGLRDLLAWSQEELAERVGVPVEVVRRAETVGVSEGERVDLLDGSRQAVRDVLDRVRRLASRLMQRGRLRYVRVTDVGVVPNAGASSCEWVYDVTVEPTHTFVGEGVLLHNTISIAKAGITAELRSRCAVLGAANPKFGRFDQNQPLSEQITLEPALMSRFDVIFTLTDRPEAEQDAELADHIMKVHRAGAIRAYRDKHEEGLFTAEDEEEANQAVDPPVDEEFLRKYIAYAKRECFPVLTGTAREHLQDYYVSIRKEAGGEEGGRVPMTPRQLEALVRLTEASARMRLSNRAEVEDAERAIDVVKYWIQQLSGGSGLMDIDLVTSGVGHSQRERIRLMLDVIEELCEEHAAGAPREELVARLADEGVTEHQVEDTIRMLKNQRGTIYSPDNGEHFKLVRD